LTRASKLDAETLSDRALVAATTAFSDEHDIGLDFDVADVADAGIARLEALTHFPFSVTESCMQSRTVMH